MTDKSGGDYVLGDKNDNSTNIKNINADNVEININPPPPPVHPPQPNPCDDADGDIQSYLRDFEDEPFKPLHPLFKKIQSKNGGKLPSTDLFIPPNVKGVEGSEPNSVLKMIRDNRHVVLLSNPGEGKSTLLNRLAYCLAQKTLPQPLDKDEALIIKKKCDKVFSDLQFGNEEFLPIVIKIREFMAFVRSSRGKEFFKPNARVLMEYIREYFAGRELKVMDCIEAKLRAGHIFLMLDGLDEVLMEDRSFVRDVIWEFCKPFSKNRILVTCRMLSYSDFPANRALKKMVLPRKNVDHPDGFIEIQIRPFDAAQIDTFIDLWYQLLQSENMLTIDKAPISKDRLLHKAIKHQGLSDLAPNPLLLTMMALVHYEDHILPDARVFLYDRIIKLFLWGWDKQKNLITRMELRKNNIEEQLLEKALSVLTFNSYADGKKGDGNNSNEFKFSELINCWKSLEINKINKIIEDGYDSKTQIEYLSLEEQIIYSVNETVKKLKDNRSPLLINASSEKYSAMYDDSELTFTLPHRTFQEYLAGEYLSSFYLDIGIDAVDQLQKSFSEQAIKLIESDIHWHEVILSAVGRQLHILFESEKTLVLVSRLCPDKLPDPKDDPYVWRKVWLAGDIIRDFGVEKIEQDEIGNGVLGRVRGSLASLLSRSDDGLSIEQRKRVGNTLAELGDSRFDSKWYLPDDPLLGFVMINNDLDTKSIPNKRNIIEYFWISKCLVTTMQYNRFVVEYNRSLPQLDKKKIKNKIKNIDNHPANGIAYQDAKDYCDWLNKELSDLSMQKIQSNNAVSLTENEKRFWNELAGGTYKITLPSNEEWERAALGDGQSIYPWGNEFLDNKANLSIGLSMDIPRVASTTTVGVFPPNDFGLYDICGNVWEWTRSKEQGIRILKGASYLTFNEKEAKCTYQADVDKINNENLIGFRLAISSGEL